jgi:hypothetical protein
MTGTLDRRLWKALGVEPTKSSEAGGRARFDSSLSADWDLGFRLPPE